MRLQIRTAVRGDQAGVFARFTKELLLALTPPGMKLRFLRYDEPTRVGSTVHLEMRMWGLMRQEWYMHITEMEHEPTRSWFTDEGIRLPGFLRTWRHRHVVEQEGSHAVIVDDVEYTGRNALLTCLLYPVIYWQFAMRRPYYRRYFGKP